MPSDKKLLGAFGEDEACRYLRRHGYKIIGRNFSCRFGEIDIIAQNRRYIVFAEVKLRRSGEFARAMEYVTEDKQRRVIMAAELWLSRNPASRQPRFDVLEVYAPQGAMTKKPEIHHIEDAYQI
ncbi:MAG: YraN family protein [Oscillospiraceae bacterium]|nr:YraN family protein [Oscillospiraceae bacterium]